MPEVAGGWPEEGAQYAPGAPMEPVQQAYPPQQPYQTQQQQYQQQGYPEPQYHQPQPQQQAQQQYPAPQAQQQYPQEQTVPQQAMYAEEEQSALPSEFDHLFRDSSPENRRAISGKQPMVSGPGASPAKFLHWRQQDSVVQDVTAYRTGVVNLTGGGLPEQLRSAQVSVNYFRLFGATAIMGRTFTPEPKP